MNELLNVGKKVLTGSRSPLMSEGRLRIDTSDIIAFYPDGVTITAVDLITSEDGSDYPVLTFQENPDLFFFGGKILRDVVIAWVDQFGSIDEVNKLLETFPTKIKLSKAKSKQGRSYTAVEFVD